MVEAFRSTLEVVCESDLIVHVVDGSAPDVEGQMDAVRIVLAEIGADRVPELLVVNKADSVAPWATRPGGGRLLLAAHEGSVMVSARTGEGIDELLVAMGDRLRVGDRVVELVDAVGPGRRAGRRPPRGRDRGRGRTASESTRIQVVLDEVGKARFREFVAS